MKIFTFILVLLASSFINAETYTPKSIGIIYRNGVSSTDDYLYDELTFMDKYSSGALLPNGERMMFRLGQEYYKMYTNLIETEENGQKYEVYSYSDTAVKCTASSKAFLTGLHGPGTGESMGSGNQNEFTFVPPYEGQNYRFTNSSSLPFQTDTQHSFVNDEKGRVFFQSEIEARCPALFSQSTADEQKGFAQDAHFSINYQDLIATLESKQIHPKGYRSGEGWTVFNLMRLYEAVESYFYATGQYFPNFDQQLTQRLNIFYSAVLNVKKFDTLEKEGVKLFSVWTQEILERILEGWRFDTVSDNYHKVMTFSTTGSQLYAFLKNLGLTSYDCLEEIRQNTKPFPVPNAATTKLVESVDCLPFPEFGSSLVFELSYNSQNEKFIRIKYNNIPIEFGCEFHLVDENYCPYGQFSNIVIFNLLREDHQAYCQDKLIHEVPIENMLIEQERDTSKERALCLLSCLLALILSFFWCYKVFSTKSQHQHISKQLSEMGIDGTKFEEMKDRHENMESMKIERLESPFSPTAALQHEFRVKQDEGIDSEDIQTGEEFDINISHKNGKIKTQDQRKDTYEKEDVLPDYSFEGGANSDLEFDEI